MLKSLRAIILMAMAAATVPVDSDRDHQYEIALNEQSSGAYAVPVTLANEGTMDMLLDTGSSYSVMSPTALRVVMHPSRSEPVRSVRAMTADGRQRKVSIYVLPVLKIGADCVLRDVQVAVVPGADRAILGLSELRRLGDVSIDFNNARMRFSACTSGAHSGNTR